MILLDVINCSKEYWDLKLQLDKLSMDIAQVKTPLWSKIITTGIPVLAIMSGFLIGWFIPSRTFKKNKEFEIEKRKIDAEVVKENDIRNLFGEIFSIKHAINSEVYFMNLNFIEAKCGFAMERNCPKSEDKAEYRIIANRYEQRFISHREKVAELNNKMMNVIGKYMYINPESECQFHLIKLLQYPYNYKLTTSYQGNLTKEEIIKIRDKQVADSQIYLAEGINFYISQIANCIMNKK